MAHINDAILQATGGPTVTEGLATWFSKTATESLQDAESRWLLAQVQVTALTNINDMWFQLLDGLGYNGSLNDMKLAYWSAQP